MKRISVLSIAVLFLFSVMVSGAMAKDWMPLSNNKTTGGNAIIKVLETTPDGTKLEINLEGYWQDDAKVNNKEYLTLDIPGSSMILEQGMPELPKLTALVAVPDGITPKVRILEEEIVSAELAKPLLSSKGHILRNVDITKVPHTFNSIYDVDAWYPETKVSIDPTFKMRKLTGARLTINPVRYNAIQNKLEIAKRIVVMIDTVGGVVNKSLEVVPKNFESVYKSNFINYNEWPSRATRVAMGKLLVVTVDEYADAMAPYLAWKKKAGWDVSMEKLSAIGTTAEDLKAYIQGKYDEGGLAYIMLVGDYPAMPTLFGVYEKAASDPSFCKLEGNDHVPDACIGRISATSVEEVENQVAKFVHYEQFPMTGDDAAWYGKGMGIASSEGNPTDYERANWLRDAMLKWNFSHVDKIYDPSANASQVAKGVNEGRSVINYIGHGSASQWVSSRFTNNDVDKLENGRKFPVIWSVACQNGRFTMSYADCFCERWLKVGTKDDPKGSVAIFGASTNASWVPPCDMQTEIIHNQMIGEKSITVGAQYLQGVLKAMEIWGTDAKSQGNMLNEQYCLFGDVSLVLRTKAPQKVDVKATLEGNTVHVTATIEGKPFNGAMISVQGNEETRSGLTNDAGQYNVTLNEKLDDGGALVTVYGQNIIPVVDQLVK